VCEREIRGDFVEILPYLPYLPYPSTEEMLRARAVVLMRTTGHHEHNTFSRAGACHVDIQSKDIDNAMTKQRYAGAPCLCNSWGHYHDGETCGKPVFGRTRGGKIKKVCDDCSHYSFLHKHSADLAPPQDPLAREPNAAPPTATRAPAREGPIPRHIPAAPAPSRPTRPPGYRSDRPGVRPDDDDISTVKF
jgi:hypothetical protein